MLMVAFGISQYNAALFHSVNYAFFKAAFSVSACFKFSYILGTPPAKTKGLDGQSAGNFRLIVNINDFNNGSIFGMRFWGKLR
ncbi:unnamed protein product [Rhizophagus irregularis]|nr:unnamed protein product [Rhizophagus irregularis]